ncbi:MAG: RagB/SusD family nutrient uptake outer membrane protein [Phaeodactylibacter sp.]|nr:RagB/SusD family nutrient uptake outer membrane protein [Phaeodactylibacter sp.]
MKKISIIFIILMGSGLYSCTDLEPEIFSEITPENFFKDENQLAAFTAAAYTPLYQYWSNHEVNELTTDVATVPIRSNGGWNDGGLWPRLVEHNFNPLDFVDGRWNAWFGGVGTCNRLLETLQANLEPNDPVIAELKALRAFYFYMALDLFGNIPLETRFAEADAQPAQSSPAEAFAFIEKELLDAIPNATESTAAYAKMNKWVAYMVLAKLYINAERFGAGPHYQEAADAANAIIGSGVYSLESGYFANFLLENEGSAENMFVVPYDRVNAGDFAIRWQALHQSANPTFGISGGATPWGGFSIQEDFYNAFDDNDKRRGMFIIGQQYTVEAEPTFSEELGFFYANPKDEFRLINCVEDYDNYTTAADRAAFGWPDKTSDQLTDEERREFCNIDITPGYEFSADGRCLYRNGARYGKFEYPIGIAGGGSNDFPIFRFADVLLTRAEALWRLNAGSAEALSLVNQIRGRAGLDPLSALTEDDLYWEIKKELALENQSRATTIRFGHWQDGWFLKEANPAEKYKEFYPIPQNQLDANPNLSQNPGY